MSESLSDTLPDPQFEPAFLVADDHPLFRAAIMNGSEIKKEWAAR